MLRQWFQLPLVVDCSQEQHGIALAPAPLLLDMNNQEAGSDSRGELQRRDPDSAPGGNVHLSLIPRSARGSVSETGIASTIYGLITVLAVLEILQRHPPSALASAATLFGTTLAVALVDAYSESIARIITEGHSLSFEDLQEIARDAATVMIGAQGPTVVLLVSAVGLVSLEGALVAARIVALISLFGYGIRVGQLLHAGLLRQVLSGLALLAIGLLIVLIKAAFH
jgi:hypothetical protein